MTTQQNQHKRRQASQPNSSNKKSFKGLKSWWNKISSRFHNIKNRENHFSHSVSINIIPDEPDIEIEQLQGHPYQIALFKMIRMTLFLD